MNYIKDAIAYWKIVINHEFRSHLIAATKWTEIHYCWKNVKDQSIVLHVKIDFIEAALKAKMEQEAKQRGMYCIFRMYCMYCMYCMYFTYCMYCVILWVCHITHFDENHASSLRFLLLLFIFRHVQIFLAFCYILTWKNW